MQGDAIAVSGTVSRLMPNALVRVLLDNGHQVLAHETVPLTAIEIGRAHV